MWHYYNTAMNWLNRLDRQEWFLILLTAMAVGALCLRGFGSRTDY